ncbi:MAG: lipocalin family protein [Flavobacteriales bacterium]|nr:lipocalin family protein [Flavobacteriales bacterium]
MASVDLAKYAGTWYEIASFPSSFQKGCNCTTATYTVEGDHVKVDNKCFRDGKWGGIVGKAFAQQGTGNAQLKVQFFWPFKGDYYIIALADDYSYALVGHPNRKYLWVLARNSTMEEATYQMLLEKASALGFDVAQLVRTPHDC